MGADLVGLADAIIALREQMTLVIDEGKDKNMQFELSPIELSLQAVLTKGGHAGLTWQIVQAGGEVEHASTQRIVVTLTPVWKTDDGRKVRDFTVTDIRPADAAQPRIGPGN